MTALHSCSRRFENPVDLNDVARHDGLLFVRDGVGVAARGTAAEAPSTRVQDVLAAIAVAPGSFPPRAIGALPFAPGGAGSFVIPALSVVKTVAGEQHLVAVADTAAAAEALLARAHAQITLPPTSAPRAHAGRFGVAALTAVEVYLKAVTAARDAVRRGEITKAVIARDIEVTSTDPIDIHAVLLRLKASFGSSYRYSFRGLVGASPELLVEVEDQTVRSNPLAGTTARTGDPATDRALAEALLASEKNQIEHRVVVDMVHDTLLPYCSYLDWEPDASVVAVANVQHLGTRVEGRLNRPAHVVDLARLLCPTPALGGHPRDTAVDLIRRVEGMDRGLYGGAMGWCDAAGNGTFAVTIRCAEFAQDRRRARLLAGGGIVADSDPEAELAETQAKFQAMLSAIVRP
ncbi:MAG: isochorismate synthase [Actinobacteria bacterium]|nr:isochorismate synthase [Actinomycetota bacterium]